LNIADRPSSHLRQRYQSVLFYGNEHETPG
jgi:hypothetical protein